MGKPKLTKTREQNIYSYTDTKGKKKYAYRYRYTRNDGKKTDAYKQGFKTAKDAALALTQLKAEILSGNYMKVDYGDMTVRQLCDMYIQYKSKEWEKSTLYTNGVILRSVVRCIGDMKIQKLNKVEYRKRYVEPELARGVRVSTMKIRHGVFSSALNFAVGEEMLDRNRISDVKIESHKKQTHKITDDENELHTFTTKELAQMFEFIDDMRPKYRNAIMTLTYTGIRVGELCGLKWKDIDFAKETISINRTLDPHGERAPKSKHSKRVLPLPVRLSDIYREMYNDLKKRIFKETATIDYKILGEEYVFQNRKHKNVVPGDYERFFRDMKRYIGLSGKPHKLRHTYATLLIAEGFDIATVAALLGDTIGTVQSVYVHVVKEYQEKASHHINDMLDAQLKNIL